MSNTHKYPHNAKFASIIENNDVGMLAQLGLIDSDTLSWAQRFRKSYEPGTLPRYDDENTMADRYDKTEKFVEKVKESMERILNGAVQRNKTHIIERYNGLDTGDKQHGMDLVEMQRLIDIVTQLGTDGDRAGAGKQHALGGSLGSGKNSYFLRIFMELNSLVHGWDNIAWAVDQKTVAAEYDNCRYVTTPTEVFEWLEETDDEKLTVLCIDELDDPQSLHSLNDHEVKVQWTPIQNKLSKLGCDHTVYITHRIKDMAQFVRTRCDYYHVKAGEDTKHKVKVYRELDEESDDPYDEICTVTGIKDTTLDWSTTEDGDFVIDDDLIQVDYMSDEDEELTEEELEEALDNMSNETCKECGQTVNQYEDWEIGGVKLNPIQEFGYCPSHLDKDKIDLAEL